MKPKQCKECGRAFVPRSGTQLYCEGPHYTKCECCGRLFEYTCSPKEKPKYCSQKCINEGKKATVKLKYGVDNVSQIPEVRSKISTANSSPEVCAKRQATCMREYSVDNVAKVPEFRAKMSDRMKSKEYLSSRAATCRKVYGHDSPMQSEVVKQKQRETNFARYGMAGHPWSKSTFEHALTDPSKLDHYLLFKQDPRRYIAEHYDSPPFIFQLVSDLGVTDTPIYDILVAHGCQDMVYHCYSQMEEEVEQFLLSIIPDITIIHNDRTVIKPLEIDLYLPEYKIGIECNPASTHNSSIGDYRGESPKHYKYHQNKSISAARNGVFLFHIYGYEWTNHKDIMKSMLRNLLGRSVRAIHGRDTYVCEITSLECNTFLDANHRQGATTAKVRLGLRLKTTDELVSVMTFSKVRPTMGRSKDTTENDWELSRFCSLIDSNVRGAAGKLFKHFLHMCSPHKVISFSDMSHTTGKLYGVLGFRQLHITSPSYVWSDRYDNKYYHRVACQKRYLRTLLHDDTIDTDNQTEKQIMESHGFVQVFDSGVIKWEYVHTI